ncbi:MAG: osmotically inducible protein OsmC [Desulfobacteraceae bacterium]|nr:osmotically inducible protein OsmC [Desulfobacteraceae bacterium]
MSKFKVTFPGNKKVDISFNNFEVKTDQAKKNEGDETAPEPFEIFLSSIAACAGIYAKSFCDTRKLDATDMHLYLEAFFKEGQKLMDQVDIMLHINQQFPEKYIKPIIKAMNGCAVKNQLHPEIKINTAVAYLAD